MAFVMKTLFPVSKRVFKARPRPALHKGAEEDAQTSSSSSKVSKGEEPLPLEALGGPWEPVPYDLDVTGEQHSDRQCRAESAKEGYWLRTLR